MEDAEQMPKHEKPKAVLWENENEIWRVNQTNRITTAKRQKKHNKKQNNIADNFQEIET